ncbi:hypothetical protein [Blastococcus sp. SYSU D00820]
MQGTEAMSSFAGEPQPVEVHHAGTWYPGVLLGWRHEADGTCRMRVRCVVGGLRHSFWSDLSALRLPGTPVAAPAPRAPGADAEPATAPPVPAVPVPAAAREADEPAPYRTPPVPRPRPWPWPDRLLGTGLSPA